MGAVMVEATVDSSKINVAEDDWSDSDEEQFASSEPAAAILLEAVIDINDNLYRLATKIRDPKTRLPSSKAQLFKKIDKDTNVDFIEEMKKTDRHHIEELFWEYRSLKHTDFQAVSATLESRDKLRRPRELEISDEILIARLAQANTYRRQQFSYWNRNRDKKAKETAEALDQLPTKGPMHTGGFELAMTSPNSQDPAFETSTTFSKPTTASNLQNPSRFEGDDIISVTSTRTVAPQALDVRDERIEVPPPPLSLKEDIKSKKYFECPYCFTICSSSHLKSDAWR
jgi:hypothetical protein